MKQTKTKLLCLLLAMPMLLSSLTACGKDKAKDSNLIKLGDYELLYKGACIMEDSDGNDAIVLTLDFTNNGKENASYLWSVDETLMQNGVELEAATVFADYDTFETVIEGQFADVAPGATLEVRTAYLLQDTTSPVEATFEQFLGKKNGKITIDPTTHMPTGMSMYMYTYDNASLPGVRNPIWWQTTVSSAGNLTSCIYRIFGKSFKEKDKKLLGVPFAQFLKVNSEFRYHYKIDKNQMIASRIAGGVIWSYGNALAAPYTEQFYIGGANSVRAFSARSIGPGSYAPDKENKYSFINHVGDIRMEANVEYRFRIIGDLHGAVFLDAGNVWLMRKDESRPGGEFTLKNFARQIALGTGAGLRYDMDFLVFRLDCGVGLHDPYDTGKSGYYNIPKFKDSLALHFAIGYPF